MKTHPMYKDRIALRFDGPPRPDGPQLLGVELNGQLISRGEWAEDDNDEWLLFLPADKKMATAFDSQGAVLAVGDEIAPRGCPE